MSNITKKALEASLKHVMLKKPLDKITIRDITDDCGISRMTFYYHFQDIYALIEWICTEDARLALSDKKSYANWTEGMQQFFDAVYSNKLFILNVYHSISRERMERFLFQLTYDLIRGVVDEKSAGVVLDECDKRFIADFYKYSFVGMMLNWIAQGMDENYGEIVQRISLIMKGGVTSAIEKLANNNK